MKELWNRLIRPPGEISLPYTLALGTLLLLMVFLIISAFAFPRGLYAEPFVWAALVCRGILLFMGWRGLKRIFLDKAAEPRFYEFWKHYTGYAVVFTYVLAMAPQVVRDFNTPGGDPEGLGFVILVLLTTLLPALHYLILTRDVSRLSLGSYTEATLAERRAFKKNKAKQKARRRELKKQRNPIQNFWYEWAEPIIGAILWVLVINHLFFQLYQIPSESMVPTFLTRDRVIALKSQYGPSIPLTTHRLPALTNPKTGQIVTFVSPGMESPDSDLRYKNVFTRVFQPLVYIITLTQVDIDSNDDGTPKARQLVKRVIGEPGEKVCLLNDEVYKKTPGKGWTLMAELPRQREYGRSNLFYDENPRMAYQRMNAPLRGLLTQAISLVEETGAPELSAALEEEKRQFLSSIETRGALNILGKTESFLRKTFQENEEYKSHLGYNLRNISLINQLNLGKMEEERLLLRYEELLGNYGATVFYSACRDLAQALEGEITVPGYLERSIGVSVDIPKDPSPYEAFMIRTNGLMKLSRLRFYNALLSPSFQDWTIHWQGLRGSPRKKAEMPPGLTPFTLLSIYTDGLERPSLGGGGVSYYNYFETMQFPEFPPEEGGYLREGEYFLMGDNRYNSVDSRMGRRKVRILLDPADGGLFSESVEAAWDGHVIPRQNIQGRVRAILFPFTRLRFL